MKTTVPRFALYLLLSTTGEATAEEQPAPDRSGHQLASCPSSPNCVSSLANDDRHRIAPLAITRDLATAMTRLEWILAQRTDATLVAAEREYLRVEFRTFLGFVDDAEFLLDREREVIHVRTASRLGWSDLGKNRRRVEEIRRAFSGEVR
jgi:uncharacterized protein (DUF1499 family)